MKRQNASDLYIFLLLLCIGIMSCADAGFDSRNTNQAKSQLSGCWGELDSRHCSLKFVGDSVIFGMTNTVQRYEIAGDSIMVESPDKRMEFLGEFTLAGDTLKMTILGEAIKAYRIKNPKPTPPPEPAKFKKN